MMNSAKALVILNAMAELGGAIADPTDHPTAKPEHLTDEVIERVLRDARAGVTTATIARSVGLNQVTVAQIIRKGGR
jgi:hypothetical protein